MNVERWQEVDDIFHRALAHDPAQRSALLNDACGGDLELRAEVEAMLSHDELALARGFLVAATDSSARRDLLTRPAPGSQAVVTERQNDLPSPFGRYEIIERIGQGGMGVVYLAPDTELERRVALKVPHPGLDRANGAIARFQREARAAATFEHPNFCRIYDVGQIGGRHFIAMAYIDGRTLSSYIEPGRPADTVQAARWVLCLAEALVDAHRKGIIHRDLKPSNIMIDHNGVPIITDFGLALRLDRNDVELRSTDLLLGTPHYMSPEQIEGAEESIGPPSDIYSLGVVLYELLTAQRPFQGSRLAVLRDVLAKEPLPISAVRPEIDPVLESICLTAMARKVGDRTPTMAAFAESLATWLKMQQPLSAGSPVDNRSAPGTGESESKLALESAFAPGETSESAPRERKPMRSWKWTAATAVAVGAIAALVIWTAIPRTDESDVQKLQSISPSDHKSAGGFSRSSRKTGGVMNSIGMRMVWVEPGQFVMGSPADQGWAEETPEHTVQITRAFLISNREVTQPQYRAVEFGDPRALADPDPLPVSDVSWLDAIEFCNKLSIKEHREPYYQVIRRGEAVRVRVIRVDGRGYRLPTEAEWEYACRAGSQARFPSVDDDPGALGVYAWFNGNSDESIHSVGRKRPNAWGLYDMLGNVWEWCQDGYDQAYYQQSPLSDPAGEETATLRVIRGGSIFDDIFCRPASRQGHPPDSRWVHLGFRVAAFEE
jgi:serine/threonine protein kinase